MKHGSLNEDRFYGDIQRRFDEEKKYVMDPSQSDKNNNIFVIFTTIMMISIVFISILYTLISAIN